MWSLYIELKQTQVGHISYTKIYKQRISYFKSTLTFLGPAKRGKSISADIQDFFVLQE